MIGVKLAGSIITIVVSLLIYGNAHAHSDRIEAIAQLSDVWAAGHYLAPDIACNPRQWDTAFGNAVERVIQDQMSLQSAKQALAATSDAYTARLSPLQAAEPNAVQPANRIAVESNEYVVARINGALTAAEMQQLIALRGAGNLIIDLRSLRGQSLSDLIARSSVFENADALNAFGLSIGALPPVESVSYQGYPSELGFSSGYFRSSLVVSVTDQETAIAQLEALHEPRLIVLGNEHTALPRAILAARLHGQAVFVSTAGNFFYGGLPTSDVGSDSGAPALLMGRYFQSALYKALAPDATIDEKCADSDRCLFNFVRKSLKVPIPSFKRTMACQALPAKEESLSSTDSYPGLASRVFAVAKLYHVLRLFHPAPDLLGDLRAGYLIALKEVVSAQDVNGYVEAIARFLAPMRDGHIELVSWSFFEAFGLGDLPISTFFHEGNVYVGCEAEGTGLRLGDRVMAVDGQDIGLILAEIAKLTTVPAGRDRLANSARYVFRGAVDKPIMVEVIGLDDASRKVNLIRSRRGEGRCALPWTPDAKVDFKWLTPQVAYLNLATAGPERIDQLASELSRARSLIVDDRGAARGGAWRLAAHLATATRLRVAQFVTPIVSGRDADGNEYAGATSTLRRFQYIQGGAKPLIKARVLVLVDDNTSSQAEHSVLMLKAAANATTIGMRTAGTLGDATAMILPGNLQVRFTGDVVEDLHGNRILGSGIAPDVLISPNLADLLDGQDPLLEAAIAYRRRGINHGHQSQSSPPK